MDFSIVVIEGFERWLVVMGYADSTVYGSVNYVRDFYLWLKLTPVKEISQIDGKVIRAYYNHLQKRTNKRKPGSLSDNYINSNINALKRFSRYLQESGKGVIEIDLKRRTITSKPKIILTRNEIQSMYRACGTARDVHAALLGKYSAPLNTEARVVNAMTVVKRLNASEIHAQNGPLWYRGNVACSKLVEVDRLDASLQAIGAKRVVIGHTPTLGRRIMERFDGRIYEVDTGMLSEHYAGSGNALIMEQGRIFVVNESSDELLSVVPHPRRVGIRKGGYLDAADIERLLASGDIVSTRKDESGRRVVTASNGVRNIEAVFLKQAKHGFYPEVAAYRLDRLLELDMVPVTALRALDGDAGSLQFLPYGSIGEMERADKGKGNSANCPLPDQWGAMSVFDALIYNTGRSPRSILYSLDNWQLLLVRHDKAFAAREGRPRHLKSRELNLTTAWKDALTALTDDVHRFFAGIQHLQGWCAFFEKRIGDCQCIIFSHFGNC